MNKSNIAILTTVANFKLYNLTSKFFPEGVHKYVIDGTSGMHGIHSVFYMFKKLSKEDIEWLILSDEDVIFKDSGAVFSIIETMEKEQITVSGVRDGGVIKHRQYNPFVVNTFFTIINFKEVLREWKPNEVKKHQYILPNEFKINDKNLKAYDINSLYEPYYCFFLWLKRKGKKFLFLDAQMLNDNISNNISFKGEVFAYHTWYARSYGINEKHTNRINGIISSLNIDFSALSNNSNAIVYKDSFFFIKMKIKKFFRRLSNKLYGKN